MMLIHVAAAAIEDDQGRILIARRLEHVHQGGLWEFPGGKLEAGESPLQALERELLEELDVRPLRSEPLIRITHHYENRSVLLDVHRVSAIAGTPRGVEGQPLRWCSPQEMRPEVFPAADRPVITALQLPSRYLITGADSSRPEQFLRRLEHVLQHGVRIVQLRAHELSDQDYRELVDAARKTTGNVGARLILNRSGSVLDWAGLADGLHLNRHTLMSLQRRPANAGLVGASCHGPEELARAVDLGLDYALLSPVLPTASHPDAEPLGWERFEAWVDQANLPVYALGGMRLEAMVEARRRGAQGIAAIRGLWPEN
ncbi:MAG: Nudix family hydrolase [endosymbiont of Seepiophila jonesi]|uniref:8-oxo-dGTP diphosphatase n=1 Tax=endosymbiont of Lamellibrachia luymesi TaxID=2200907 RepID=A0A370DWC7_9GAMM|nr:MAG: Nudix family hydrolase [endosymbiont of Seepiophila jonesi]RDH90079.1 MAG: Nudix family hydrolase [endosymbiont of Lamellibrachia luymesi]